MGGTAREAWEPPLTSEPTAGTPGLDCLTTASRERLAHLEVPHDSHEEPAEERHDQERAAVAAESVHHLREGGKEGGGGIMPQALIVTGVCLLVRYLSVLWIHIFLFLACWVFFLRILDPTQK